MEDPTASFGKVVPAILLLHGLLAVAAQSSQVERVLWPKAVLFSSALTL